MSTEPCATCEEEIRHTPVYFDGQPYCCVGCIAGGPCLCTYLEEREARPAGATSTAPAARATPAPAAPAPRAEAASDLPSSAVPPPSVARRLPPVPPPPAPAPHVAEAPPPATQAPTAQTPTAQTPTAQAPSLPAQEEPAARRPEPSQDEDRPRRPIPFRRPGEQTVVIHAHGFANQRAVLTFASQMEEAETFSEVSLTRVTTNEAWFAVRAVSTDHVTTTLRDFAGFDLRISVDQNLVTVDAAPAPAAAPAAEADSKGAAPASTPAPTPDPAPTGVYPEALNEGEPLLPPRPRFRVFRPAGVEEAHRAARPASEAAAAPAAPPTQPADAAPPAPTEQWRPPEEAELPGRPGQSGYAGHTDTAGSASPRTAAPAAPAREPAPAPEAAAGQQLTLVVYPFHSFAALNDFQSAVRRLRGVTATRVRRFYRGTLHLAVDYEGVSPLSTRINDLTGFRFDIASASRSEIEVVLADEGSVAVAQT